MPNYVLSRTSPPAHIYERKINLGYGIKVDTSDAPTPNPKERKEDVLETPGVVETAVLTAAFADGTVFENRVNPDTGEAEAVNEAQNESLVNRD